MSKYKECIDFGKLCGKNEAYFDLFMALVDKHEMNRYEIMQEIGRRYREATDALVNYK